MFRRVVNIEGNFTLDDAFWSASVGRMTPSEAELMLAGLQADPTPWLNRARMPIIEGNPRLAREVVDACLLDSGAGSGNPFDWKIVRTAFNNWHGDLLWNDVNRLLGNRRARFIIAGGLNPESVGQAMKFSRPGASTLSLASSANPVARIPKK